MTSLEIKLSVSGDELESLQKLAGTVDNLVKIRSTARMLFKAALVNATTALQACLEGRIGDLDIGEDNIEEQKSL